MNRNISKFEMVATIIMAVFAVIVCIAAVWNSGLLTAEAKSSYKPIDLDKVDVEPGSYWANYIEENYDHHFEFTPDVEELGMEEAKDLPLFIEVSIPEEEEPEQEVNFMDCLGDLTIEADGTILTMMELPTGIDISSMQPYEDYTCISNPNSAAYQITRAPEAYNDMNGFRRYPVADGEFSINGEDDYVVALGTGYKPKGTCGSRFLVVTTKGVYTVITGDEKSDAHTDATHRYSLHGEKAGVIEWIVNTSGLSDLMRRMGSAHYSPVEAHQGDIVFLYKIN